MTKDKFDELLTRPESSTLDFKADLYDFANDTDNSVTAKFIKDVISFCNTIREESAYIIFGITELPDNSKKRIGITKTIDDAILQDKVKNKLYPIPKFQFSTITFQNLTFGVLEFPVRKYEFPISSTVKLKGVEIGKAYYRQGSSNTEALSLDTIKINNWLHSLPHIKIDNSTQVIISELLKRLLAKAEPLSSILPDIQLFSKQNNYTELKDFCDSEIKGFNVSDDAVRNQIQDKNELYKYRVQTIKMSLDKIIHSFHISAEILSHQINNSENFYDMPYFFREPIATIEDLINRTDGYATVTMKVKDVLPNYQKDYPVYAYIFNKHFQNLYQNIRQKLIDLLMDLK